MRFDYYAATIHDRPQDVIERFADRLGAVAVDEARGLQGYAATAVVRTPYGSPVRILHGGVQQWPHVVASGQACDDVVPVLRECWPAHQVSRVDSEQDFEGANAWDVLLDACLEEAAASRLKLDQRGDWLTSGAESGRTLYVGAPTSEVRARLYEKGKQLRIGRPDLVRLETQDRPVKEQRWTAATLSPEEVWGLAKWTRRLQVRVTGLEVPRVALETVRIEGWQKAVAHAARQYARHFELLRRSVGSWEAAGEYLGQLVEELQASAS